MSTYQDRDGNTISVVIDAPAIERCRSVLGVDLYDLSGLGALAGDMLRFLRVVHCVLAPAEDFGTWWKRHTGSAADACVSAFIDSLCDFYPSRLAALIREMNKAAGQAVDEAFTKLESEHAVAMKPFPAV